MLYLVEHHRFVKLLGVAVEEKNFGIISELIPGKTMDVIVLERRIESWEAMIWIFELLEGMVWLSKKGIVHRDLKPSNLIISDSRGLVIIDLGMSAVTREYKNIKQVFTTVFGRKGGTPQYMAPEMFPSGFHPLQSEQVTSKADVWSWACIVSEIFKGEPPIGFFQHVRVEQAYHKSFQYPVSPNLTVFRLKIKDALQIDANKRPTFKQIKEIFIQE